MTSFVKNVTFDCQDALRVARFWADALGSDIDEGSRSIGSSGWGHRWWSEHEDNTLMHDPEGHEFCVEPGPGDRR